MSAVNVTSTFDRTPQDALNALRRRVRVDGYEMILDLDQSQGSQLRDAISGREYIDLYTFYASAPIGFNHPRMHEPEFQRKLLSAAITKVANSDMYTMHYADFVSTLDRVAGLPGFVHYFFVEGGSLAIENAIKAAFDWKVRKNMAAGRGEIGQQVIHFKQAFHGRSGYTLSLTNTSDPRKTMYFPKFSWPRIDNPKINFALPEPQRTEDVAMREAAAVRQIEEALSRFPHDVAALVIETIQGEGGDNHFRPEFFRTLRKLADQHEFCLIFDEVQCGMGITGKTWACEHMAVMPDFLCFGKKMQVCGFMATDRVDEVDSVFKVSSRINSTWGGNLVDMVRAAQFLRIIEDERLVERAARTGLHLLDGLQRLAQKYSFVTAPRGRGLMCAFDLPSAKFRDDYKKLCQERQLLVLACGDQSIRFRPTLDIEPAEIDRALEIMESAFAAMA
jgi:L-lysine 6-transaminase